MERLIRVLVVDDDPIVRSALTLMLGKHADLEVVGECADGAAAVEFVRDGATRSQRPVDVILMDIRMPGMSGLKATELLHADPDPPRVIILTTFDADENVRAAMAAGADGFLLKDTPPEEIVAAIGRVVAGDPMLSPSVTASIIRQLRDGGARDERGSRAATLIGILTERELEVARAVGRGLANGEIAAELHLSLPTVKTYVSRLLDKLEATNRVQVAILVHDAGLE